MPHEHAVSLFEVFKRSHQVGIGKLAGLVKKVLRKYPGSLVRLEKSKHIPLNPIEL